jgi:hypothetical protein
LFFVCEVLSDAATRYSFLVEKLAVQFVII